MLEFWMARKNAHAIQEDELSLNLNTQMIHILLCTSFCHFFGMFTAALFSPQKSRELC